MADAKRDENNVPTLIAALNTDGVTPTRVKVSPSNHGVEVNDGTTGSDHGTANAARDNNFVPVLLAVSSVTQTVGGINYVQGITPVEVYADSSGNLLINSS